MKTRFWLLVLLTLAQTSVWAACSASIRATTPNERFIVDTANGLVTDKVTGLIWQRCSLGQTGTDCSGGSAAVHNWQQALQAAQDSTFAGHNDWRLPNSKELGSLVEERCSEPAINSTVFPGTASLWYWSSSPSAYDSSYAWGVSFGYGYGDDGSKYNGYYVRLVRGGQ